MITRLLALAALGLAPSAAAAEVLSSSAGHFRLETRVAVPVPPAAAYAALGPLQAEAVTGTLSWTLRAAGSGTEIVMTYAVSGHAEGGLAALAAPVDGVMRDQTARLAAFLATAGR